RCLRGEKAAANTPDRCKKRRGRDSNPRQRKTPRNGFRDRRIQPSEVAKFGSRTAIAANGTSRRSAGGMAEGQFALAAPARTGAREPHLPGSQARAPTASLDT